MTARNAQVSRIYCILTLLENAPQGFTVGEIWERVQQRGHDAGKRTVYRDLEALQAAGFPLLASEDAESRQRWSLERTSKVTQYLTFTARELFALFLTRSSLHSYQGAPFYSDIESAHQKIEEKLGRRQVDHLRELSNEVRFHAGSDSTPGVALEILETVRLACSEGHVLEAKYSSASSQTNRTRRLGPHYLYFARGSIYLVAEDLEAHQTKLFSLTRFSSARMTEDQYAAEIPSPEVTFAHSMGVFVGGNPTQVELLFDKSLAAYVRERKWHTSQITQEKPDGSVHVSLQVALSAELFSWVLGFGPRITVLEPKELKAEVIQSSQKMLSLYPQVSRRKRSSRTQKLVRKTARVRQRA